jgi:hypothetical protein
MATVLEASTIEEQSSDVRFCGQKDSMQRIFVNKCFLSTLGGVCRLKRPTTGSKNCDLGGKRFTDNEEVETEVRKWLRQQSKDFYAAGFDALVKRWDECISQCWCRICREIHFFPGSNITCFTFYVHVTYLLTPPRI